MNVNQMGTDPISAALWEAFDQGKVDLQHFNFPLIWNPLLASAQAQQATVTIDPGISFLVQEINLVSYSTAGVQVVNPDYLLSIEEQSGATFWGSAAVHVGNWTGQYRSGSAGTGAHGSPGVMQFPRYIRGNNTITGKLTNQTVTQARVDLVLRGIRITFSATPFVLIDTGLLS